MGKQLVTASRKPNKLKSEMVRPAYPADSGNYLYLAANSFKKRKDRKTGPPAGKQI